jgi:hypothetical protein
MGGQVNRLKQHFPGPYPIQRRIRMQFLVDHSMYVTLVIVLLILAGLLLYMNRVDARVRTLEQKEQR